MHLYSIEETEEETEELTREELRHAVKAYRMLSKDEDFDQFHIIYEKIAKSLGKS